MQPPPRVVLVTSRHRLLAGWPGPARPWQALLGEQIRGAICGGVDLVQVREPDLDAGPLAAFLRRLFAEVSGSRARVVVNERLDVAWAVASAGVHLPERSLTPVQARSVLPTAGTWVIGRSVHGASAAEDSVGASYLIGGTVLPSVSKAPGSPSLGWNGLRRLVDAARGIPVVAIGGLTEKDVPRALAAGATGVAAVGYFVPQGLEDVAAFVKERVMTMRLAFDSLSTVPYTRQSQH
ncbi:MAG: thiamine phosphate synthase [Acidobacteriota bacterium]|nr:thiamine phosphate synthase [Acidobacteriota bacterium]